MSASKTHETATRAIQFPFYLWLIGTYPILHLYSVNFGLVVDHEVLPTLLGMLGATTVAFFAAKVLFRGSHKSAFLVSLASLFLLVEWSRLRSFCASNFASDLDNR